MLDKAGLAVGVLSLQKAEISCKPPAKTIEYCVEVLTGHPLRPVQAGVSISASDETSIDVGVLSFQGYTSASQQALTQYNVHSVCCKIFLFT